MTRRSVPPLPPGRPRPTVLATLLLAALLLADVSRAAETTSTGEDEAAEAASEAIADAEEEREEYDPFEGIDPDGRIPRVARPGNIQWPERWRYIPEGRIKPGNIFQRFLTSSFILPLFFRNGDVGTGGGVAVTDIDFRQQRRREFAGIFLTYTSEGQQRYSIVWRRWIHHLDLADGGVLQEERSFWRGSARYSRTLTRRFFGIGPTSDEDDETSYTDELWQFSFGLQASVPEPGSNWIGRLGVRAELHDLAKGKKGDVPSMSSTREMTEEFGAFRADEFTRLFDDADSRDLGWLVAGLAYDTRDSQRNPYRGWRVGALAEGALVQTGREVGARYTFDASKVFPLPGLFHSGAEGDEENPPTDTFAIGWQGTLSSGDLPFFDRPGLGGADTLRGYIEGRWRDDTSWHASAEYRFWILTRGFPIPFTRAIRVERVGMALFYDTGLVAGHAKAWFRERVRHSYGFGLRITLERAAPFRIDFGFSDEDFNLSARFGLSF